MRTRLISTEADSEPTVCGHLTIITASPRRTIELKEFSTIGRDIACDLNLHDDSVSLRHARIELRAGAFYIRDLRSRNGTFVNGAQVIEAKLTHMDRIHLGETDLIFTHNNLEAFKTPQMETKNPSWASQLSRLANISQSHLPVLISGPSGSGKEILAQTIHRTSNRANGPFVSVNCGALTETLIESELFGHQKGSFTGAMNDRKGAFETARRGTLFLDEIGELPLSLQPKLLRALENSEIKPVGGDRNLTIDVRIVAATNRNLKQEVLNGKFREDLYFRLNVLHLDPPNLKDRMEDFDELLRYFSGPLRVRFTLDALQTLREHSWPGNIRELKNTVSRASALYPDAPIGVTELKQILEEPIKKSVGVPSRITPSVDCDGTILPMSRAAFREFEKELILERMRVNLGNQRNTAKDLGLPKSTLHDRLRYYGIDPKSFSMKIEKS